MWVCVCGGVGVCVCEGVEGQKGLPGRPETPSQTGCLISESLSHEEPWNFGGILCPPLLEEPEAGLLGTGKVQDSRKDQCICMFPRVLALS